MDKWLETPIDPRFDDARRLPAFADHDDSLLDLSDGKLRSIFQDLTRRCCLALAESIQYTSDSNVDDVNILSVIIPTIANIVYRYDYTMNTTYDAFFYAINAGLLNDLQDLRNAGNSYDNALINDATIWRHMNIVDEYA